MPADMSMDIKGLQQFAADLEAVKGNLGDLKAPSRRATELVQEEAQRRAPYRSGALRRGIKPRIYANKRGIVKAKVTSKGVPYAARQHWVQQKGRRGDQYLWAANYVKRDDVHDEYRRHVDRELRRIGGRYG